MIFFWKGGPATSTTPHSLDAYGASPLGTAYTNVLFGLSILTTGVDFSFQSSMTCSKYSK